MRLIVDCGATKTLWHLVDGHSGREVETAGFNLAHTPEPVLHKVLGEAAAALHGAANAPEIIQKRMTTLVSDQPFFSK